ncbi:zeta toxin family protein [Vampirovibrio sp.]|uniref:zeta toxin family protein n=1 Tax=Vampirovibrio sp. TaxID=2717857 RepID=UPI003593328E
MINAKALATMGTSSAPKSAKEFLNDGIQAFNKQKNIVNDELLAGGKRNAEILTEAADSFSKQPKTSTANSVAHQGDEVSITAKASKIPTTPERQWKLNEVFSEREIQWIKSIEAQQKALPVTKIADDQVATLISKNYGKGATEKGKQLHLVVGPPGSGKSSVLVDPLSKKHGAMVIDSDAIKPQIEGYKNGLGTNAVHPASAKVANQMLVKAMNNGDNIVHPIVGRNEADLIKMIEVAKSKGYKVGLHLADVPPQVSAQRVIARAKAGAAKPDGVIQMVSPDYALNTVGNLPQRVFESVKSKPGLVSEFSHFNTNVPWGQKPILVQNG